MKGANRNVFACEFPRLARILVVDRTCSHCVPLNDEDHAETFRYFLKAVVIASY